jgi:hypothetical protein
MSRGCCSSSYSRSCYCCCCPPTTSRACVSIWRFSEASSEGAQWERAI